MPILPVLLALSSAAEPSTSVAIPWGQWVVAAADGLTATMLPVLIAALVAALARLVPFASLFISQAMVERLVRNAADYALNAVRGAVKDEELTVETGSSVIARAVQRAVDQAPGWLLEKAGGPAGVAEKVFRTLHLEPDATVANTLAPALAAAEPIAPSR